MDEINGLYYKCRFIKTLLSFFSQKRYFIPPNCYTIINFIPWLELWTDRQYGKRVIPSRTSKTWIFYDPFPRTPNRETLNMTHNSKFHEPEWNSGLPAQFVDWVLRKPELVLRHYDLHQLEIYLFSFPPKRRKSEQLGPIMLTPT